VNATAGRVARGQAWLMVTLRWLIVAAWAAGAGWIVWSGADPSRNAAPLISLVPGNAPALRVEAREQRLFSLPLSTDTAVVQRWPSGISAADQAAALRLALAHDRQKGGGTRLLAVPVPNTFGLAPGSRSPGSAIVTYLEHPPGTPPSDVIRAAGGYAQTLERRSGHVQGVTGILPGEWREGLLIQHDLGRVELATVLVIALLVALAFRSLAAALMTLAAVGIANLFADQLLVWAQVHGGVAIPDVLRPMQVALVLGVGTDYCVFYLSSFRQRTRAGEERLDAAKATCAETAPIVLVGGLILAAGLGALEVARVSFFRGLGPGLAITVVATMAVCLTFVPAAMAILGGLLTRPLWRRALRKPEPPAPAGPGAFARLRAGRPLAAVTAILVVVALGAGATQVGRLRLGFTEITGLPSRAPERVAYDSLVQGFAPGMLAPTRVVVWGRGVGAQGPALARLQSELERQPGVAGVLGPPDLPSREPRGVVYGRSGSAARFVVVLAGDPFGAQGLQDVQRLAGRLRGLTAQAGLHPRGVGLSGDSALGQQTTAAMRRDVLRVSAAVLVLTLLLLAVYLRSLVAPLLLVCASVLSVAATLGITAWVFGGLLGYGEMTYWVPYAAAVLLFSLGSDYNVFVTGRMWQAARVQPLRSAVAEAGPRAAGAVRTAGLTLAASFAAVALIPVRGFREFAFAMALGVALETFVVRPLLVPAMISLVGYPSGWPGGLLRRGAERTATQPEPTDAPAEARTANGRPAPPSASAG
jgi:putative drug exporter of the RND superfamily